MTGMCSTRTQQIFNSTFNAIRKLKGMNERDSIVATQKITDLMLKQYSPATSNRDYDKYAENYVVNDEKFMDNFIRTNFQKSEMSKEELAGFMDELKADLANKKKINIPDKDINSKNVDKSEKHNEAPAIAGPEKIH